jgi:hypothetical protein
MQLMMIIVFFGYPLRSLIIQPYFKTIPTDHSMDEWGKREHQWLKMEERHSLKLTIHVDLDRNRMKHWRFMFNNNHPKPGINLPGRPERFVSSGRWQYGDGLQKDSYHPVKCLKRNIYSGRQSPRYPFNTLIRYHTQLRMVGLSVKNVHWYLGTRPKIILVACRYRS